MRNFGSFSLGLILFLAMAAAAPALPCDDAYRGVVPALHATRNGITPLTPDEVKELKEKGYIRRKPFFNPEFGKRYIAEMKRLKEEGKLTAFKDRVVDGVPTEWGTTIGPWKGGEPISPVLKELYEELQKVASFYNQAFPEHQVDPSTAELNMLIAMPGWTGLHLHVDNNRFTPALLALPEEKHRFVRVRTVTFSVYFREDPGEGGGLFVVEPGGRERTANLVPADDNSGVMFFARTPHKVDKIPPADQGGGIRYSFQIFFHAADPKAPPPRAGGFGGNQ